MATITKVKRKGGIGYQAKVRIVGFPPRSKTFDNRKDAAEWARQVESSMHRGDHPRGDEAKRITLRSVIERYRDEIAPTHRGVRAELERIRVILRQPMCDVSLADLNTKIISEWRNSRLALVSGASVRREFTILKSAIEHARRDWGIELAQNPMTLVRRPAGNPPRDRRLEAGEWDALMAATAGCRNPHVRPFLSLAVETAMRRGELIGLKWAHVDLERCTATLPLTKNGHGRTVPLTRRAVHVLSSLPRTGECVFDQLTGNALLHSFKRLVKRAGIDGLHIHDLRHEAISRFVERGLNVLEVAAISGHRDMSMLKRYTHLRAEDLAAKLNEMEG